MKKTMTIANKDAIHSLNELIETTLDSADGYQAAAKSAANARFKALFAERAQSRRQIVAALQAQVRSLGGTPEDDGTILAAAHRAFLNLKNAVTGSDQAVVNEVEAGEDHIKRKYEEALKGGKLTGSPAAFAAVTEAYSSVKADHDRMRDLKLALKAA
jgi:uncharacterized protein (TIGR02284 family)